MLLIVPFLFLTLTNCQLFSDAPAVLWTVEFDGRVENLAMDQDGTLYLTGYKTLYALDSDGNVLWECDLEKEITSIPVIGPDGNIYLTTYKDQLFEFTPNGNIESQSSIGFIPKRLAFDNETNIILIGYGGHIVKMNSDGITQWEKDIDQELFDVSVGSDGMIYTASADSIYALNPDGSSKWTYRIESPVFAGWTEIAIGDDNSIYFVAGDIDRCIYALSSDGTLKWKQPTGEDLVNSPVIDSDGSLYFTSWFGGLHALEPNGAEKWTKDIDGPVEGEISIDTDGTIYFGDGRGILHAVDADGEELWNFKTEGKYKYPQKDKDIYESPIIGDDGTIYFLSYYIERETIEEDSFIINRTDVKTYLYALEGTSSGLADSPWPRVHHDNRNTSCAANN